MNERIAALKELATRKAIWPGDPDAGELNAEMFAELIVQECADIPVHNQSGWEAGMRIKEYFGIKE